MHRIVVVFVVFVTLGIARADSPEVERAIKIGGEGIALYEQRRYVEAYERFAVADRMAHSVVFVLYMARCKRNLGELLAARALLEQAAREPLPAGAPAPMQRARDEATPELAQLAPRIPSLVTRVRGQGAEQARVRIDGRLVEVDASIELDPGEHTIEVTSDGAVPIARTVQLAEGSARTTVDLVLVGVERQRGSRRPAWIAFGVGVAGVGAGTITGIVALRAAGRVQDNCIENHCFERDRAESERASRYATASTVSFAIAGVSIAAGVALWMWSPGRSTAIVAGPSEVAIVGRF
jgi:hypothetical protein